MAKDLFKLTAVAAVYVGAVWLAAMTIQRGVFWVGLVAAALGIRLFWSSHRIDVIERGGRS